MGTAPSRLDEVQPPADWQPSSNDVGFRLISPTSDISDPSCRIQQQQKVSSALSSSHLTPTLDRRRNSKVVARNLPPRPRPVPTPSSFYFPTRESEEFIDQKGIRSKAQMAKQRVEDDAKRRLSKTKVNIQKRALQAKQCLAACIEEPMHQIEKIKDRIAEGKAEYRENMENQAFNDLDLNYNRLSTDTTRSVNAAIAKGDKRKKKSSTNWEPRLDGVSKASQVNTATYDDAEGRFNLSAPTDFEPVFRESHITMIQPANYGGSTPLDPMFTVDIALHHEETYFQRLSAASQYGASPAIVDNSRETKLPPPPTPQRVHYISSPDSFGLSAGKEIAEGEMNSPVASLFMNAIFDASEQDTKSTYIDHPIDDIPLRSASSKAANSKTPKIVAKIAEAKSASTLATERKSNVPCLDPAEAEDWLTLGGIVSPRASMLPPNEVKADHTKAAAEAKNNQLMVDDKPQSTKALRGTKIRKDSPFRPIVRGFGSKPFPIIKSLIGRSPSADNQSTEISRLKKEPKLSTRSFDDYGAVHKLWLLPNVLAAAKAISGLDQGNGNGTPIMTRWKTSARSPADDSVHSSMMMSPGPLLTDQVLCNAAFLFSPSYVGRLERIQPSRGSGSVAASRSPFASLITTHGSRSHLPDYSRRSHPPVNIPLSDSQQLRLQNSHELHSSNRTGSLESKKIVRFSIADEDINNATTTKSEAGALVARNALAPALKQRASDASSVAFTGYQMPAKSYDLDVSSESDVDEYLVPPPATSTFSSPRFSSSNLSGAPLVPAKSVTFETASQPSTPVASSERGTTVGPYDIGVSPNGTDTEDAAETVGRESLDNRGSDTNDSMTSMNWSYRSVNGQMSAVTPMHGKRPAKQATNSPFLRFKAAKNRFSNPPTKTTPVRKTQKKVAEVSAGGIVSSRVTEIDGRLKCTRPRSLKKMIAKRGSGAPRGAMVDKPVFRNPVIMGFKAASSFSEGDEKASRESLAVCLGGADVLQNARDSRDSYKQPDSRGSLSSFPLNEAEKSSLMELYKQLNSAPASSVGSSRYSLVSASSTGELQKVSTPSSVGPFTAFDGTPVSPDHSEATDATKRGTLRTPLQRNPEIFSALKMSMSSAGVSPEPSPMGSCSIQSGSSKSDSPFGALKLQDETHESFSNNSVGQFRLFDRRDTMSSDTDVSEDMFDTLMNSDARALLGSSLVSDSEEDSQLDPFQDELVRPSLTETNLQSGGIHIRLESVPSQRSLLSEATSTESSRFFSTLRRDASLRSLATESHRSNASGSTTLSAIIQKENLSYLPFRHEAPVKPSELRHHAAPGALNLSPLQRTPMQASKWRTLAAAAHEKRKKQNQIKHAGGRGILSERKSSNQRN